MRRKIYLAQQIPLLSYRFHLDPSHRARLILFSKLNETLCAASVLSDTFIAFIDNPASRPFLSLICAILFSLPLKYPRSRKTAEKCLTSPYTRYLVRSIELSERRFSFRLLVFTLFPRSRDSISKSRKFQWNHFLTFCRVFSRRYPPSYGSLTHSTSASCRLRYTSLDLKTSTSKATPALLAWCSSTSIHLRTKYVLANPFMKSTSSYMKSTSLSYYRSTLKISLLFE